MHLDYCACIFTSGTTLTVRDSDLGTGKSVLMCSYVDFDKCSNLPASKMRS
jgi:hypothetical protein